MMTTATTTCKSTRSASVCEYSQQIKAHRAAHPDANISEMIDLYDTWYTENGHYSTRSAYARFHRAESHTC